MRDILVFTAITFLGTLVQSFGGFAGALTALPLFAIFLSPKEAIPTYNMVILLIDIWLVYEARHHLQWRSLGTLLLGGCLGVPLGALGLKHLPINQLNILISVITSAFAVLLMMRIRIKLKETPGTQMTVGFLGGFLGGSISTPGPPLVIYGMARGWNKEVFRTTCLGYFVCTYAIATFCHWRIGLISHKNMIACGFAILPAFAASSLGIVLKNMASETLFRYVILLTIIAASIASLLKTVWPH